MDALITAAAEVFGLGPPADVVAEPMVGSANRLWRFDTPSGAFVVKELSHDTSEHLARRRRAASFERSVFESGVVAMPEPVLAESNEIVVPLPGSRGQTCAVRVHRWLDGDKVTSPEPELLVAAGASLHVIQRAGAEWSSEQTGSIRWWDVEPLDVALRLRASPLSDLGHEAASIASEALTIVAMADQLEGAWGFSHCDHKPENTLAVDGAPAVLDWDECGHCHPRLEAVEAALRWAGPAEPDRSAFEAFLAGYSDNGGQVTDLSERDFGKWLAALLGWFSFQGRRALGDWPSDTAAERQAAGAMARDAIAALHRSLSALPTWVSWC